MGKAMRNTWLILQIVGNRESPWKDAVPREARLGQEPLKPGTGGEMIPKNKNMKDVLVEVDPVNFMIHRFVFTYAGG